MPASNPRNVIYKKSERVARIALNRPEVLNAINLAMLRQLEEAIDDLRDDESISIIVLEGNGRAFCSGQDLKENRKLDPKACSREALRFSRLAKNIRKLDKIVIAAVNGYALAGGCELAMLADIIVASRKAKFGYPEAKVGALSGMGNFYILPRIIGEKKAKELFLLGEMVDAFEAKKLGMVNFVVPEHELASKVDELVRVLLGNAPISLRYSKLATDFGINSSFSSTLAFETRALTRTFESKDYHEGLQAFRDRRKPEFTGD